MKMLTKEQFNEEKNSKIISLVDFYADWCGPCKMMSPVLEELSNDPEFRDILRISKLDTEQYPDIAQDHEVQGIPCLIFFKEGKEIGRIVGFAPKPILRAKIKSIVDSNK